MAHYAAMLAHALISGIDEVEVACFVCSDFPSGLLPEGMHVFRYKVPHSMALRQWPLWVRAPGTISHIRRDVQQWHPDVIHLNSGHLWYAPLLPQLHRDYPLVYTMHDAAEHPGEWRIYERSKMKSLLKHAHRIMFHADSIRDRALALHGMERRRTSIVPHGLLRMSPDHTQHSDEQPFHLVLPGRIRTYKGYEVFLRALPRIVDAVPEVRVTIAGEGDIRPWRQLINQHADCITLINRFLSEAELFGVVQSASLVVLPYVEASQSGIALLAASCEKAVVASRVGAIADAVEDGVTGRLVPRGQPDELAEAIIELLRDPEGRHAMGREAKRLNEVRYGPVVTGDRLRQLYRDALQDNLREARHA